MIFIWGSGAMAGLSGSLVPNALQSEVVSGGETLVITLTGDTWDPTIGADNALTTALINGLVSAGGEAGGWNAQVTANLTYVDVTQTSNTVATITLPARPTYGITSSEVITVTLPAATVVGGTEIVAAPTFSILPASASTESRVAASTDDAEELLSTNAVTLNSLDLQLIDSGGAQEVGMRFLSISIPPGASITNAYVEFTTILAQSGATDLTFRAEAVDDSTTFAPVASDVSGRTKTTASVAWSTVPAWNTLGETHQTPNLAGIIQEVVDRAGWTAGSSISIFVTGTGARTATSYDGSSAEAPLLHVDFNPGPPLPPPNTLDLRVSASTDDAEEMMSTGAVDLVSPTLELVDDSGAQQVGMRFQSVSISTGSIVTRAYLEFTADVANFGSTNLTVEGQASDNSPTFTSGANDLSTRLKTTTSVDWSNVAAWSTGGQTYQSADLSPIIQELIDRGGWASGNSIALFVTGGGRRTGESWDGNAAAAPLLHLEYMAPPTLPSTTVEVRISADNDDAEEAVSGGAVNLTSGDLEFVTDGGDQIVGMRWASLPVPPGVTITNAYIELTTDETTPNPTTNLTFWAQAADSPGQFTTTTSDISNRAKTTSSAAWNGIPSWTTSGQTHQTPDLSALIQEVIDRPGWASNNAIAVISEGTGERIAWAHDGLASAAALLHVEYAPVCDDGNPCTVDVWDFGTQACGADAAAADGFACSDSLYCSTGNLCSAGVCGAPVDCSYLDGICTVGFCDEGQDACVKQNTITWHDPDWLFRKPFTVDSTKVTSDLDDFPVLVSVTDTDLANGARADGFDILFTDSNGTAKLDHEIEKYDGGTGELVAWVRVRLSSSQDKTIYMYYGNATAGPQDNPAGVWAPNFAGVWHMAETPGVDPNVTDSTSNANSGSFNGGMPGGAQATAKIGGGLTFDGVNDFLDVGDPADGSLDFGSGSFSYSAWVFSPASAGSYDMPWHKGGSSAGTAGYDMELGATNWTAWVGDGTANAGADFGTETLNQWIYVTAVVDRGTDLLHTYWNGAPVNSTSIASLGSLSTSVEAAIGASVAPNYMWNGTLDEVRVASKNLTAAWIQTEYNNQNSPGTFSSVGAEQGQLATCQDCDDGNPCTVDTYDSGTQSCTNDAAAADGLACNDGLFCTIGGTCSTGVCGAATDCSSLDSACAVGTCDEAADSCVAQSTGTWYDASWTARKSVTVDSAQVTADLTDFPVLVSVTDTDLAAGARADGWDIVFTDDDETTKLAHEIERYNPATGELVAWVKVPNLTGSTDKVLYMYYGNPTSSDEQNVDAVWDANFVSVHHLKESPASGSGGTVSRVGSWTTGLTHTVGAGTDRLLVLATGYETSSVNDITGVTYGGQTMIPIAEEVIDSSGVYARSALWYLNEAGIQAASGTTFIVTYSSGNPSYMMHAAATYQGVDQSAPIADSSVNSSLTVDPITTPVSTTAGDMSVSIVTCGNNGAYTWGNGWTEGTDQLGGATSTMSTADHPATGGTDTASADYSATINRHAIVAATLNATPATGSAAIEDSTSNTNDGSTAGGMDSSDQVTGQMGYGLDFDGSDDYVNVPHHADYETNDRTLSAWVYNTDAGGEYRGIIGKNREAASSAWIAMFRSSDASGLWHLRSGANSSDGTGAATGTWTYLVMTNTRGGAATLYRNGNNVDASFTNSAGQPVSDSYDVSIGRVKSVSEFFEGRIDEARWSKTLRTTDWIQTEYNNQSAPGTFLSLGSEEDQATACGSCDDGNPCTIDSWDSGTSSCIYDSSATDGFACSDGQFCTTGNICGAGVCGTTTDCSFLDGSCQIGVCDEPSDSCIPQQQGVCNCDDGNACTVDSFDTLTFTCVHDPAPVDGLACDDGLFCSVGETCSAGFCRSSVTYDCTSLDAQCQSGVCDEGTDSCVAEWHGTWKDPLWGFRKTITVDQTKVPSDQTDYPMLVSLTDSDLSAEARSDGRDIFFTEIDGITKLDHELERYQSGSGTLVAWVRIPNLTSSSDKQIYMYYGNSGASAQENPTAVWDSNYLSVYHMNQNPSSSALGYVTRSNDWTTGTSHTAGSGEDRLLLFVTGHEDASGDTDVTSVSYGGQSLTQIVDIAGGGPGVYDIRVSSDNDDAEETVTGGSIARGSNTLNMVTQSGNAQLVGMRFQNLNIPQGATITNAYVEFRARGSNSGATNLVFHAQAIDDAPNFSSTAFDISTRTTSTASVSWNGVPSWTDNQYYQTPDLTSIVQEVVNRAGWSSDDIVIIMSGTGERRADSRDGSSSNAPLLHVDYDRSDYIRAELWYLDEAGIQAATGNTFSLGYSSGSPDNSRHSAVTYRTVDQSNPIGDADNNSTFTSDPITRSVSVSTGSMAVAGAVSADSSSYAWNNSWYEGTDNSSGSMRMSAAEHFATSGGTDTASANYGGTLNAQLLVVAALNPENGGAIIEDATSNNRDGQTYGSSWSSGDRVDAMFGQGLDFDANDEYIEIPHESAYELSNGTVEVWFEGDSFSGDRGIWSKDASGYGSGGHLTVQALGSNFPQARIQSSSSSYTASGGSTSPGSWYNLVTTFGSGTLKLYRNGGMTSNSTTTNLTSNQEPIAIGASTMGSADLIASAVDKLFDGEIDEVRFSNIARSADWITTQYTNYATPLAFYTVSVEEPLGSNNCATPDCDDADVCTVDWFDVGTSTCIQDTVAAEGFSCTPPQACAPGGVCVLGNCASLPVSNTPTITIDSTKVIEDLTNYPLLVSITDTDLRDNARADGWDIWFADSDSVTKLDHEIESYDSGTGTLVAWVRIPNLSSSADKVIYLNYGNPSSPDQSNPPGVWDSTYAGVWHLNEDPSGTAPQSVDSTSNSNDGTSNGTMTSGDLVTGKIAGALDFDGTDDWVQAPHTASVNLTGTGLTLSGWVSSLGQTADVGILLKSTSGYQIHLGIESGETGNFRVNTPDAGYTRLDTTSTVPTNGTWTYLTGTYDGTTARIYFNGSEQATDPRTGNIDATTEPVLIGRRAIGDARFMNGDIDEVRMSSVARSAGWIQTEYNNQSSPSTFLTLTPGGGACAVGDHFVITHDGNGINCLPETITVTVVDGAGATVTDYIKPVVLSTQNGKGTWINGGGNNGTFSDPTANDGLATYTFADTDNGVATFALDYQEGPALVDIDVFDPAIPTFRDDDTEGLIYFSASNFTVTQNGLPNPPPGTINDPIQTQTAGKDFPIHLAAYGQTANHPLCGVIETYDGSRTLKFWSTYSNPVTGTVKATVDGTVIAQSEAASTSQTLDFSSGQGDVIVKYKDVGQIQITMKDDTVVEPAGGITGVSNLFVVKPADFDITVKRPDGSANPAGDTPGGGILTAAGAPFQAIVEVRDLEGDLTPNYGNEIAPEGIQITASTLVAPAGGRNGTSNDGAIGNNRSFAQIAPSGTFSGAAFYWDEVGAIKLQASIGDADYLGAGDVIGQESASVGRFIPDYLETSLNAPIFQTACGAGGYSYLGDSFDYLTAPMITVTAKNAAGGTTQNYNGTWAKLSAGSLTALAYSVATGALSAGAPNAPTVTQAVLGVGSLAFNNGPQLSFLRSTPEAPFYADIGLGLNVFDQDSVGSPSNPVGFGAATAGWGIAFSNGKQLRFGRAVLVNAHGSELLPLPVPLKTQYYNGANFIDHTSDSCTTFTAGNLTMTPNPGGLSSTATIANNPLLAGDAGLALSATGSGNTGYYDLSYTLTSFSWLLGDWDGDSAYDDDPASRATFGIFKGSDMLIYSREIY